MKYKLRSYLDFFPYEHNDNVIRCHARRGFWLSVVMSIITAVVVILIAVAGFTEWRSGERGYQVSTALSPADPKKVVPVNVNGTGLRVALLIQVPGGNELAVNQSRNDSFIKVRFRSDAVPFGNHGMKEKVELGAAPCLINTGDNDVGNPGDLVVCPVYPGSLAGRFSNTLDYHYVRASVEVCAEYCGKSGQIPCSQCASKTELDNLISQEVMLTLFVQQVVNVRTMQPSWVGLPQTFYLAMGLTPKVEVFVRHASAVIRDKTWS